MREWITRLFLEGEGRITVSLSRILTPHDLSVTLPC